MPLDSSHLPELLELGSNREIWQHMSLRGHDRETLMAHLKSAMLKRATGEMYPFTIIDKVNRQDHRKHLFPQYLSRAPQAGDRLDLV